MRSVGVLEWKTKGVLLRAQADDLDWIARELARLPFDFSVRVADGAARRARADRATPVRLAEKRSARSRASQISDHILNRL